MKTLVERGTWIQGVLVLALCTGGCSGKVLPFETGGQAGMAGGEAGGTGGAGQGGTGGAGGAPLGGGGATGNAGPAGWLAFDSDPGGLNRDIFLTPATGGLIRPLVTNPANDREPTFSPDGTLLAFVSDREDGRAQIYVQDLASGEVTQLTDHPDGVRHPAFSSDGKRVGFRSGASIYTIALDGSDEQTLGLSAICDPSAGCELGGPVFSTDGRWIVYDTYNQIAAEAVDGSDSRVVVPPTTAEQSNPTISPDGFTVALQVTCGDGNLSIWAVPFSGITGFSCDLGRRLSVAGEHAAHPQFGPGGALAWDNGHGQGKLQVWAENRIQDVTSGPTDDRNPTWVPSAALSTLGLDGI